MACFRHRPGSIACRNNSRRHRNERKYLAFMCIQAACQSNSSTSMPKCSTCIIRKTSTHLTSERKSSIMSQKAFQTIDLRSPSLRSTTEFTQFQEAKPCYLLFQSKLLISSSQLREAKQSTNILRTSTPPTKMLPPLSMLQTTVYLNSNLLISWLSLLIPYAAMATIKKMGHGSINERLKIEQNIPI